MLIHKCLIRLIAAYILGFILFASVWGGSIYFLIYTIITMIGLFIFWSFSRFIYLTWVGTWIWNYIEDFQTETVFTAIVDLRPETLIEWGEAIWMDLYHIIIMGIFAFYLFLPPVSRLFWKINTKFATTNR